ncbi:ribonuclease HI [Arcobacter defluvii]|uniref:Ribonuclease H family protein n=1 Tax=Arcobacter defluvii TaxID=873191 RepID=A0AAE7E710_9BACT|nr:RNase H family protein [Arcobacter defluvii]QKF77089.1 ribonuclease H family protein [Arcobacter defluvii]RXI29278.1 ribonuclease H [Arcobacter defluvii]
MKNIKLFTDSSVNPQEKIGFGSFLIIEDENLSFENLRKTIKTKKFENTSSTKLELQTLLWALDEIKNKNSLIEIYTDCQNIINLKDRREKLEKNEYKSSKDKLINNHELYKLFFEKSDKLDLVFIKVKGHKKNSLKDEIDTIFNLVDKASRNALRNQI